ncbi:MAG: hypothetical protein SFU56_04155 [Capsulimonadales bacterium]|nr:hypothetical protein [Capsulimonadales bacterium]
MKKQTHHRTLTTALAAGLLLLTGCRPAEPEVNRQVVGKAAPEFQDLRKNERVPPGQADYYMQGTRATTPPASR